MNGTIIVAFKRKVCFVESHQFIIQEEDKTNYFEDLRLFLTGLFLDDSIIISVTLF
jgi:hypothetical protein